MASEVVIWPWRSLYGLGGPYMALRSIYGLGWPQRSASDNLNIAKCPWWKVRTKFFIWPLRSLYGLGGQYMALEVMGWPLRSASDDLWGWPQISSILLSARDENIRRNSLYGLWGRYMAFEVIIWPWRSIYGLGWPLRSASDDLWGRPQMTSEVGLYFAKCPWRKV